MGLLDFSGFVGDDTVKDEYGMTQADRRQPLFTGLLKAGMLGMAAGENITPGQRAQLMANMGGAIADVPEAMNRQKAEAAQMQLRRQQFTTNQQKLEQAQKLRAYAQTPEYAELIKDAPPHIQAGLKFAIEAGDADSVQRLLSGIDATAARTRGLDIKEQNAELNRKKFELAVEAAGGYGNTEEGRMHALLDKGKKDPEFAKDDKYATAWNYFNRDNRPVTVGNTTIIQPRLSNLDDYPKPGAAPAPGSPAATQPKIEAVPPNEVRPDPATGTETWTVGDRTYVAHADDRVDVYDKDGKKLTTELPKEIPPTEQAKMNEATALRAGINDSAQKFLARWKAASPLERAAALVNKSHPLNQAWVNTMLQAKGDALYNLGVLNKGDLPQLQKALSDPNTPMSAIFSTTEDVELQVADMLSVLDARRKSKEDSYKEQRRRRPQAAAAGSGGGGGGGGGAPKPPRKNEKGEYVVD